MKTLLPALALALLGLTVTAALVASIIARGILVDEAGSEGPILIIEFLGLFAGLAVTLWGTMSAFLAVTQRRQAQPSQL